MNLLATALGQAAPPLPPVKALAPEGVATILEKLDSLLAANDAEAIAVSEENTASLLAVLGSAWNDVGLHIGRFEFEAALRMLRALRRKA